MPFSSEPLGSVGENELRGCRAAIESAILHSETERPGDNLPSETHRIISCRYHFAARMAKGKRVLEVGSGPGIGLALLSKYARLLVGAEYSHENIRIAQQHYEDGQKLVRADAHKLPFSENSNL